MREGGREGGREGESEKERLTGARGAEQTFFNGVDVTLNFPAIDVAYKVTYLNR